MFLQRTTNHGQLTTDTPKLPGEQANRTASIISVAISVSMRFRISDALCAGLLFKFRQFAVVIGLVPFVFFSGFFELFKKPIDLSSAIMQ